MGDTGSIPGSGRPPGGGNGNLLQYSCLKNSMGRGAWQCSVHGVAKSWTQLRTCVCVHIHAHTYTVQSRGLGGLDTNTISKSSQELL